MLEDVLNHSFSFQSCATPLCLESQHNGESFQQCASGGWAKLALKGLLLTWNGWWQRFWYHFVWHHFFWGAISKTSLHSRCCHPYNLLSSLQRERLCNIHDIFVEIQACRLLSYSNLEIIDWCSGARRVSLICIGDENCWNLTNNIALLFWQSKDHHTFFLRFTLPNKLSPENYGDSLFCLDRWTTLKRASPQEIFVKSSCGNEFQCSISDSL